MAARLLIVEDDPVSQDVIRQTLRSDGHVVDVAADSFEGLARLRGQDYDLALVDYHLPDLDGYASARLMRDLAGAGDGLRLVALTADRAGLSARAGAESVFDAILAKPIEPSRLRGAVAALLGGARAAQGGAPAAAHALLREPDQARARAAAEAFWRGRGLAGCPKVAALPAPGPEQRAALSLCFDVVEPEAADLVAVLGPAGLEAVHDLRLGPAVLKPLVDMSGSCGVLCDTAFRINEPASWSGVAEALQAFAGRRTRLAAPPHADPDLCLLATLFVSARPLAVPGEASGAALVPGGFRAEAVRQAAHRLLAAGLLRAEESGSAGGAAYALTEAAIGCLTGAVSHAPESEQPAPLPAGARLLLVEDLDINRQIARAMLEAAGYRVDVVGDGAEAVAAVQRTPYDLVLMDVQMPGMDGVTATRHIRAFGHVDLPIVGMSADAGTTRAEALIGAGMSAVLAKPFGRDELCAAVECWRRAAQTEAPAESGPDRAVYDELLALIGPPQVAALLDRLAARLAASFEGDAGTQAGRLALGRDAHAMVSAAGMLGFHALSEACRALEGAAASGDAVPSALARVRVLSRATIEAVAALKQMA